MEAFEWMASTWFAVLIYFVAAVCAVVSFLLFREVFIAGWRAPKWDGGTAEWDLVLACLQDVAVIFVLYCAKHLADTTFGITSLIHVQLIYAVETGEVHDQKTIESFAKISSGFFSGAVNLIVFLAITYIAVRMLRRIVRFRQLHGSSQS